MPVVVQYTTDVGREEYDTVALAIRFHDEPPPGLIVHTAAVTGDGRMRIFDVWQTLETTTCSSKSGCARRPCC